MPLHKGLVMVPLEITMMIQYGIDLKECPPKKVRGRLCCKNKSLQWVEVYYPRLSGGQAWKHADDG